MARFTAVHYDSDQDVYYRVSIGTQSADDVEQKIKQFLYEKGLKARDFDKDDISDLQSFGDTLCVFSGDLPNLITPDKEVESLEIPMDWEADDETPTE